jgi:hypothetical protein
MPLTSGLRQRLALLPRRLFLKVPKIGTKRPSQGKPIADWALDAAKTLVWPILVTTVFVMFRDSIADAVRLLPEKLRESNKISVGSLSFEIQERAARQGNARAAVGLRNLSKSAITLLLRSEGITRHASTNDDKPDEITLWNTEPLSELIEAGFIHMYRSKRHREFKDLTSATFAELLAEGAGDNSDVALAELDKRGQSAIASELIRAKSKDLLGWLMSFGWKNEKDGQLSPARQLTSAERTEILELTYTLSPSGRALYEAMISVVSERLSQPESSAIPSGSSAGFPATWPTGSAPASTHPPSGVASSAGSSPPNSQDTAP